MTSAHDSIYWAPLNARGTILRGSQFGMLVHLCPTAVLIRQTPRDTLDPMATGRCRYCDAPLPVAA